MKGQCRARAISTSYPSSLVGVAVPGVPLVVLLGFGLDHLRPHSGVIASRQNLAAFALHPGTFLVPGLTKVHDVREFWWGSSPQVQAA